MLACNSIVGAQKEHLQTSLDIVQRSYSHDLKKSYTVRFKIQNQIKFFFAFFRHFLLPSNTLKPKILMNACL